MGKLVLKKNIYPKWFIYFLCWFIPSSKNRKNLKKYISISKINIYKNIENEIYKIKLKEMDLDKKLNDIINLQDLLSQKLDWSIHNNISIHSHTEAPVLKIPGGKQTEFLVQNVNNQLCFSGKIIYNKPKIYVVTLPKAGTYFMGKLLEELDFSNTNLHSGEFGLEDYRNHDLSEQLNFSINYHVNIPFYLQSQLLCDGQFIVGHLPFSCYQYINTNNIILLIRDLRKVFVSALRFMQKRDSYKNKSWFYMGVNEEALLEFFSDTGFIIYCANELILWKNKFPDNVIKYEDLINEKSDNFLYCIEKIQKSTNSEYQDVLDARDKALNSQTLTYSGKPSTLANIWTERVEEKFVSLGCDVLNEQLGYPREWNAKNYPS